MIVIMIIVKYFVKYLFLWITYKSTNMQDCQSSFNPEVLCLSKAYCSKLSMHSFFEIVHFIRLISFKMMTLFISNFSTLIKKKIKKV